MREKERRTVNETRWDYCCLICFNFSAVGSVARTVRTSGNCPDLEVFCRSFLWVSLSLSKFFTVFFTLSFSHLVHSASLPFSFFLSLRCPSSVSVRVCSPQWSTSTKYRTKDSKPVNIIDRCSCTAWSWPLWEPLCSAMIGPQSSGYLCFVSAAV